MQTVRHLVAQLESTLHKHRLELARIRIDPELLQLRDDVRQQRTREQLQQLRRDSEGRILALVQELWGTGYDESRPLAGGLAWESLASAERALRLARTAAEGGKGTSAEVHRAEQAHREAEADAASAWEASRRAVDVVGGATPCEAALLLRRVSARYELDPVSGEVRWQFAKRAPQG